MNYSRIESINLGAGEMLRLTPAVSVPETVPEIVTAVVGVGPGAGPVLSTPPPEPPPQPGMMKKIERIKRRILRGDLKKFNIGHPLSFLWKDNPDFEVFRCCDWRTMQDTRMPCG